MQCCTCSKWVHLKCSLLFFSKFRSLGSFYSWSFPPCLFWGQHCDFLLRLLQLVYLHCSIWSPLLMQHPRTTLAFKPLIPFLPLRIVSLCTLTTASCSWMFLYTPASSSPLTPLGSFKGMLGISEPKALNYYTLCRLISLTLFVTRHLILIYLPLSGFLDSLLCDLIAPTPGLVFFATHASGSVIIFVRQGLSFSELSTSSFSFLNAYTLPIRFSPTDSRTDSFSLSILPSSFWRASIVITPSETQKVLSSSVESKYSVGLSSLTSSPSMILTYLLFSIAPLAVAPSLTYLLLPSDHLPILQTIPLPIVFCPNERLFSFKFQKARWDEFAFYFDSLRSSAEKYSSLSLSYAAALFNSLKLYALLKIWCSGQTALFLPFLAKADVAYLPTAHSATLRPPISFQQFQ